MDIEKTLMGKYCEEIGLPTFLTMIQDLDNKLQPFGYKIKLIVEAHIDESFEHQTTPENSETE